MKKIFESPEVMAAYAEIDLCMLHIKHIQEELLKKDNSPILIQLIDWKTGFSKQKMKEQLAELILLVQRVIKAKMLIDADYTNNAEFLFKLIEMHEKHGGNN